MMTMMTTSVPAPMYTGSPSFGQQATPEVYPLALARKRSLALDGYYLYASAG